jgi:hypothetical protein
MSDVSNPTPDSEFYKKQIREQEKLRSKFDSASYDSTRNGYVVDGKLYSEAERQVEVAKYNKAINSLKADEKKFGVYGPGFGASAESNPAGKEFLKLYKKAAGIKVKDYDSSIANLEAWKQVEDFIAENPDIKIVSTAKINDSLFKNVTRAAQVLGVAPGKPSPQKINTVIDIRKDPVWKRAISVNPKAAVSTAKKWAEKDTIETRVRYSGENKNTAKKTTQRVAIDEDKFSARKIQIDSIVARQPVPETITAATGSKVQPKPVTKTTNTATSTGKTSGRALTRAESEAAGRGRMGVQGGFGATAVTDQTPQPPPTGGGTGGGTATKTRQDFRNSFLSVVNKQGKTSWKTVNQYINAGKDAKEVAARQARWDAYVTKNSVPGGVKKDGPSDETKVNIQEEFGSLWDIYNEDAEVKKVIDLSVKEGWFNDPVKMEASLTNTNWFRTTQSSARKYMINQSTDPATAEATLNQRVEELRASSLQSGVTLSDESLRRVGEQSLKFSWSPQQMANAVGSEAVATANRGGPTAVADLRKGTTGTRLRQIADSYGIKVNDTMLDQYVANVVQGTSTEVQFTDLMKSQASTMYRSLAPQIEKGIDVKTATSMYTNTAASVLGVDPSTVDWTQDKWNKALNYQDPKTNEYRQMDSYEWNRYLRSLPEWQETDDAKSTYRRAAFTLAQAFGKTS